MSRWFDLTSSWVLSAGIHLVLLLGAGLVCLEELAEFDDDGGLHVGLRSILPMAGDGTIPRFTDRMLYRRLPLQEALREKSELFEKDGSASVWMCKYYAPDIDEDGGTSCPMIVCGYRRLPDSFDDLLNFRSLSSFARSRFETARGCRYLSPRPLKADELARLSFLGGMNALPLGITSVLAKK
jgi:hypothetical protein